jgi:hypothetical protein
LRRKDVGEALAEAVHRSPEEAVADPRRAPAELVVAVAATKVRRRVIPGGAVGVARRRVTLAAGMAAE